MIQDLPFDLLNHVLLQLPAVHGAAVLTLATCSKGLNVAVQPNYERWGCRDKDELRSICGHLEYMLTDLIVSLCDLLVEMEVPCDRIAHQPHQAPAGSKRDAGRSESEKFAARRSEP